MKSNIVCFLSYNGTNFRGWAKQPNQRTVESEIESSLKKLFCEDIKVFCSGRTDAEVHAISQVFNFFVETKMKTSEIKKALNSLLPRDIVINKVEVSSNDFNARFSAIRKEYYYLINTNKKIDIFDREYIFQYNKKIDLKLIKEVSKKFIGTKDFSSFSTSEVEDKVRTIHSIRVTSKDGIVKVSIVGNGFLRSMVRMIVGSLLAINDKKITTDFIDSCFDKPSKGRSIYKVPGCGLYLNKVFYENAT
jgi:tRNA pseudouridine38-40 synthase